jgi:hypothetical protein
VLQVLLSPSSWLPTLTPVGLCAAFTWLVVTGKLVPKSTVDRLETDKDQRISYMETAAAEQRTTINTLVAQNAELSVSGRLSVALLQSLQSPNSSHAIADSGSSHVATPIQD